MGALSRAGTVERLRPERLAQLAAVPRACSLPRPGLRAGGSGPRPGSAARPGSGNGGHVRLWRRRRSGGERRQWRQHLSLLRRWRHAPALLAVRKGALLPEESHHLPRCAAHRMSDCGRLAARQVGVERAHEDAEVVALRAAQHGAPPRPLGGPLRRLVLVAATPSRQPLPLLRPPLHLLCHVTRRSLRTVLSGPKDVVQRGLPPLRPLRPGGQLRHLQGPPRYLCARELHSRGWVGAPRRSAHERACAVAQRAPSSAHPRHPPALVQHAEQLSCASSPPSSPPRP
mmetsp:Transcript_16152/g.55050  ORF Transcript_16152/g.55050 Transcript_16152/m.55050 type:complete len:286 (-) Transcript_16152:315-1172(-)